MNALPFPFFLFMLTLFFAACTKNDISITTPITTIVDSTAAPTDYLVNTTGLAYAVKDASILKNGVPTFLGGGANAFHSFGLGDSAEYAAMATWNIKIVREFIGNLRENPLTGMYAIQSSTGAWLQPLQNAAW